MSAPTLRGPAIRAQLIDERAGDSLRLRFGQLLASAAEADFAVARIRIAGIDLANNALASVKRCRVLIGRLDAEALSGTRGPVATDPDAAARLAARIGALRDFLESGRLEVRAAGLVVWTPDFSILRAIADHPAGHAVIVGAHYLVRPSAVGGPSFTCILSDAAAVRTASTRFDELWDHAYDVSDIVHDALDQMVNTREEHPFPHDVDTRPTMDRTET